MSKCFRLRYGGFGRRLWKDCVSTLKSCYEKEIPRIGEEFLGLVGAMEFAAETKERPAFHSPSTLSLRRVKRAQGS